MQLVLPALPSVSVTEPAPQVAQAIVDVLLKVPATHAVHAVAPLRAKVFVRWPLLQLMHEV